MINFDIFQILQTLFCKIRDEKLKKTAFRPTAERGCRSDYGSLASLYETLLIIVPPYYASMLA